MFKSTCRDNAAEFIYSTARRFTVPTEAEKVALILRYQAGDERAGDEMVERNLKLVMQRVNLFGDHYFLDPEDLIQEGAIGLKRACRNFNPELGFKFSTYAARVIDQHIRKYIRLRKFVVKLPPALSAKLQMAQRTWSNYVTDKGEAPTQAQLAELCDLSIEELNCCKLFIMDCVSLSGTTVDETELSLADTIPSHKPLPEDIAEANIDKEEIGEWLEQLGKATLTFLAKLICTTPKIIPLFIEANSDTIFWSHLANKQDQTFIGSRYGIGDGEPKTRLQLSQRYRVSEIEVQRWEKRILDKLKLIAQRGRINEDLVNAASGPKTKRVSKAAGSARNAGRSPKDSVVAVQVFSEDKELARA